MSKEAERIKMSVFLALGIAGLWLLPRLWAKTEDPKQEAVEEHEHGSRHGGLFGDADDQYHYEVLLNPRGELVLYLNDDENQPLDTRKHQARWQLNPDQNGPAGDFKPSADGAFFSAVLPDTGGKKPYVEVSALKDGQWMAMEFDLAGGAVPDDDD
jgi:hypothetical protein